MDQERHESEKMDEVMLPGFRFHPTDEELVGFYLRRKIQQRPLSIELIKQLDIYKFDPWDLPKLAATGEKEWYFYCPRDRKYRNSARPNRVTGAGFWKATGTDRPIYSSEGSKCIGLKKSLVFYKGRAAKGIKTDWMMHEFRLPSIHDTGPSKRFIDKDNIPANDAWAICRIFKKANSSAQRALSQSWVSNSLPEISNITPTTTCDHLETQLVYGRSSSIFSSSNDTSQTTKNSNLVSSLIQFGASNTTNTTTTSANDAQQQSSMASFSPFYTSPSVHLLPVSKCDEIPITSTFQTNNIPTSQDPSSSLLLNMSSSSIFGDFEDKLSEEDQYNFHSFSAAATLMPGDQEGGTGRRLLGNDPNVATILRDQQPWETIQSVGGYPNYNLPFNNGTSSSSMADAAAAWKCNFFWDSSPCPSSDLSTCFSTNKCYT